jgi:hypothetical protein
VASDDPDLPMHRIAFTKLSEQQILDKLGSAAAAGPTSASRWPEGLSLIQLGAHARHTGRFDVARFFEPRA